MSVLIKGMSMPKEGSWVTLRVFPDGQCFVYSWCGNDFDFMEHLTAVPVPPHGDLIDRYALEKDISESVVFSGRDKTEIYGANKIINRLHHAPTIVEADRGDAQ